MPATAVSATTCAVILRMETSVCQTGVKDQTRWGPVPGLLAAGGHVRFARTAHCHDGPIGPARVRQRSLSRSLAADERGGGGARRKVELEQNIGDVTLDGVIAQPQMLRDGRIAQPVRH